MADDDYQEVIPRITDPDMLPKSSPAPPSEPVKGLFTTVADNKMIVLITVFAIVCIIIIAWLIKIYGFSSVPVEPIIVAPGTTPVAVGGTPDPPVVTPEPATGTTTAITPITPTPPADAAASRQQKIKEALEKSKAANAVPVTEVSMPPGVEENGIAATAEDSRNLSDILSLIDNVTADLPEPPPSIPDEVPEETLVADE